MTVACNIQPVLELLSSGTKTNADIAHYLGWTSAEVASLMSKMRHRGYITRELGRGRRAAYSLP